MRKLDRNERAILSAYEKGLLVPARSRKAKSAAVRASAVVTRTRLGLRSLRVRSGSI
jgi:hypothetical protein